MSTQVFTIPQGTRGFDCNTPLSASTCEAFRAAGYGFAIRYVPRVQRHTPDIDITTQEVLRILSAGLGLMIVQHVQQAGWTPLGEMGAAYGATAAREAHSAGVPTGVTVWCDLEGVARGTQPTDVIAFCNRWYDAVAGAGYVPGLYVGFDAGLSATQLYSALKFSRYWAAYNLNRDQYPAVRGVCVQQGVEQPFAGIRFDPDTVRTDARGGLPTCVALSPWLNRV